MNREQFLRELQQHLGGYLDRDQVDSNVAYYDNYFAEQESAGRSEADVLEELGSPRLIAISILEAAGIDYGSMPPEQSSRTYAERDAGVYENGYDSAGYEDTGYEDAGEDPFANVEDVEYSSHSFKVAKWTVVAVVVLALLVICTVISLVTKLAWAVLRFFLPVILVIIVVCLVISFFRDR